MGRGRAKAKQVKVARRLKYNTSGTDLDRLREELGVGASPSGEDDGDPYDDPYEDDTDEDLADRYADYPDDEDDEAGDDAPDGRGRR
ncbi:MAG: DUF3073 family protein [Streptosporangiales bacterium]|nr:DUF3073 family protein [Streptosporangiales bacterium]